MLFIVGGIIVVAMGAVLLDRDYLKSQLVGVGVYQGITDALVAGVVTAQAEEIDSSSRLALSDSEIRDLVQAVLPAARLQSSFEELLDSTLDWLRSDEAELSIVMDLSYPKATLRENIEQQLRAKGVGLPLCSPAELQHIARPGPSEISCLPPGLGVDEFLGADGLGFYEALDDEIPSKIRLDALLRGQLLPEEELDGEGLPSRERRMSAYDDVIGRLNGLRQGLWWYETGIRLWAVVASGFLLLMLLLRWRKPRTLLAWVGMMSLAIGVELGVIGYGLRHLVWPFVESRLVAGVVVERTVQPWLDRGLLLFTNYLGHFAEHLNAIALPLGVVGGCCLMLRLLIGRQQSSDRDTPALPNNKAPRQGKTLGTNRSEASRKEPREIRPAIVINRGG